MNTANGYDPNSYAPPPESNTRHDHPPGGPGPHPAHLDPPRLSPPPPTDRPHADDGIEQLDTDGRGDFGRRDADRNVVQGEVYCGGTGMSRSRRSTVTVDSGLGTR